MAALKISRQYLRSKLLGSTYVFLNNMDLPLAPPWITPRSAPGSVPGSTPGSTPDLSLNPPLFLPWSSLGLPRNPSLLYPGSTVALPLAPPLDLILAPPLAPPQLQTCFNSGSTQDPPWLHPWIYPGSTARTGLTRNIPIGQ